MLKKRALITGINGQDGSYLSEKLLSEDYEVFGLVRRVRLEAPERRLGRLLTNLFILGENLEFFYLQKSQLIHLHQALLRDLLPNSWNNTMGE